MQNDELKATCKELMDYYDDPQMKENKVCAALLQCLEAEESQSGMAMAMERSPKIGEHYVLVPKELFQEALHGIDDFYDSIHGTTDKLMALLAASPQVTETRDVDYARVPKEQIEAVLDELHRYRWALEKCPDATIAEVNACACMGPPPPEECPCKKRNRLVQDFIASNQVTGKK